MRAALPLILVASFSLCASAQLHVCTTENPAPIATGPHASFYSAALIKELWKPGETVRIRFLEGSPTLQSRIQDVAKEWTNHANINFQYVATEPSDVRISFKPGGSWSYVGTVCKSHPNEPTMNFGWFNDSTDDAELSRTTLHEFGHMLGLVHEHQSPAASIPWDRPAVYQFYATTQKPPWDKNQVDNNIFATYNSLQTNYSGFDDKSIMLYAIPDELTVGNYEVKPNTVLSATDKDHIKKVYPGIVAASYKVTIRDLVCRKRKEVIGRDEVHVKVFADGNPVAVTHPHKIPITNVPVFRMTDGNRFAINQECTFSRTLRIEVWDIDNPNKDPNDLLGVVTLAGAGPGQQKIADKDPNLHFRQHEYILNWE